MNIKTRIGGILKNSTLARISVIGLPDRPGMAAMILGALGNAHINVEFIIQCIDLNQQDHFVLCIERDDLSAALRVVEAATREVRARSIVHDGRAHAGAIAGRRAPGRQHRHLWPRFSGTSGHCSHDVSGTGAGRYQYRGHQHLHFDRDLHHLGGAPAGRAGSHSASF